MRPDRTTSGGPITVVVVGIDEDLVDELAREDGFSLESANDVGAAASVGDVDAVVLALNGGAPLEALGSLRAVAPDAAVVVITDEDDAADGTVAVHAGADEHLVRGSIPPGLLPRAVRYAVGLRRLRMELATFDDETGLPNLRGFAPIAEHHLRMADRAKAPVVFLFVRIDGLADVEAGSAVQLAKDTASVLLDAVRDADVPARISRDTFCVLLTGEASGAETLVLSRLVEAIAVHDARSDAPRELSLSVGSALYDPERTGSLEQILSTADRHLTAQVGRDPS